MDITPLKESGLTDGEIKVYLALLGLGSSTTGPIIEKSGIAKSIVYQILERLMQKGLVSFITSEKTKYFQAAEPKKLLQYVEEREKKLQENKNQVAALLPELELKQKMAKESQTNQVRVYKGFKGITTAHEHTYDKLGKDDEYYYLGVFPEQESYFHAYWQKDHMRRAKAGIGCKLLFNQETDIKILNNRNSFKHCDARYMPIKMKTPAWFMGYKDTAVIGLQEKQIAIEIVDQQIADSFKAYFDEFWKLSKKLKKI
ncbi:hypothetical protein HYY69_04145 [Candidatus Woesearchaeota archaeon]|nr:hypothetical protein [Candidatus Woesearchaeota archaeon]